MDSFNKVISFVLGLVVVIVFLAIVSGKINLKKVTTTKTNPTLTPTPTVIPTQKTTSAYNQYNNQIPKKIPATGLPTIVVPLLFSSLAGGIYLASTKTRDF